MCYTASLMYSVLGREIYERQVKFVDDVSYATHALTHVEL
jgi:hypothetical protein